jgi:hypothetical protein
VEYRIKVVETKGGKIGPTYQPQYLKYCGFWKNTNPQWIDCTHEVMRNLPTSGGTFPRMHWEPACFDTEEEARDFIDEQVAASPDPIITYIPYP